MCVRACGGDPIEILAVGLLGKFGPGFRFAGLFVVGHREETVQHACISTVDLQCVSGKTE